MTEHLILLAVGPVQEFIAQARRTRDLWYGSHLLSELGRCGARVLAQDHGAWLIFPALDAADEELTPCLAPLRPGPSVERRQPPLNIANRILAVLPDNVDPRKVAQESREAIRRFWRDQVSGPVRQRGVGLIIRSPAGRSPTIDEIWGEQIDSLLEINATWAPLQDYRSTRSKLEAALAARKNLRDFRPWRSQRGSVPKSSLDGARETILRGPEERDPRLVRRYRIASTEQLDAVGLVKRTGGEPDQFLPITNVALASWLDHLSTVDPAALARVSSACESLGLAAVVRPDLPSARLFPYDASIFLPSRWRSIFDEQQLQGDHDAWGRDHITPTMSRHKEPYPYVACLVADGDRMGDAINELAHSPSSHRAFSHCLSTFSTSARRIVEQDHLGSLVYAGGDDVLAFLPLPMALRCADQLRREFERTMQGACEGLRDSLPTLSVGIGIGHVMEGMGDLLELGRRAEQMAKGGDFRGTGRDRNGLALIVDKRSGGRATWRARWDDWDGDPAHRLELDAVALRDILPSRKVYEIEETLRRLPSPKVAADNRWSRILVLEVQRSLSRVRATESIDPASLGLSLDPGMPYDLAHGHVESWVERMLIARVFAMADPRKKNGPGPGEDAT